MLIYVVMTASLWALQRDEHSYIIKQGTMTSKIKAKWTWGRVALFVGIGIAATLLGLCAWWFASLMVLASFAWFSFEFRAALNESQGWDRNYLGSTSWYDVTFICIAILLEHWRWTCRQSIKATHQTVYHLSKSYRASVHHGGRIASTFEVTVMVCSLALAGWLSL